MDKDFLHKRLQEIEKAIQNFIFQHHAAQGAKQEILNLLAMVGTNVAEGIAKDVLENAINDKIHHENTDDLSDGS